MAISQITDMQTWENEVLRSDVPVFVDFWAEWCGPCRMVGPVVEDLSKEFDGKVKFVKVNVDQAGPIASRYQVMSIPTLVLIKGGEVVKTQVGAASKESFSQMIQQSI